MSNLFKIKKYWILTFCMVIFSITSMYSQYIPDNYLGIDVASLTSFYKTNKVPDYIIVMEINKLREDRKKDFLAKSKNQEVTLQENLKSQRKLTTKNTKNQSAFSSNSNAASTYRTLSKTAKISNNVLASNAIIVKNGLNTSFFLEPITTGSTYKWTFYNDDTGTIIKDDTQNSATATQRYDTKGSYLVQLVVTDASGCTSIFKQTISVSDTQPCIPITGTLFIVPDSGLAVPMAR
jgi:PKD domain